MQPRFLEFLEWAPRSAKPRTRGLQYVGELGQPLSWVREQLEAFGAYVDHVKLAVGQFPTPARVLEQKVQLYRDYQIDVSIDDPTFTIAYLQGKAEQFLRAVRGMGFTHVQIQTREYLDQGMPASLAQAVEDEAQLCALARELGLKLEGEVGQKYEEGDLARAGGAALNVKGIVAEMRRQLALGCDKVFLESAVIRLAVGDLGEKESGTAQIQQIVDAVGPEHVVLEINGHFLPLDVAQALRFWAVRTFGPEVNMGGSEPLDFVPIIEAIRRGIMFVKGPSKASSRLWVKSLARGHGRAATEWWTEPYPIHTDLDRR
jgi:phosphosulfolactate synthase (CoM biosynthesis protein A)